MILFVQIAIMLAVYGNKAALPVVGLAIGMALLSPVTWAALIGFFVAGRDD